MNQNVKSLGLNIAALAVVVLLIWKASSIMFYILISCGFGVIGNNLADKLENIKIKKKGIPRWFSALLIINVFYLVLFSALSFILPTIDNQIETISNIDPNVVLNNLQDPINAVETKIQKWSGDSHFSLLNTIKNESSAFLNFSNISNWVSTLTSMATELIFALFSITFITFFLIKDGDEIYVKLLNLLSDKSRNKVEKILANTIIQLRKYFIGVAIETLILIFLLAISLWIAGVEQYFIIAIIAALLNIIPYIGPISAMAIAALIIITGNHSMPFQTELLPLLSTTMIIMIVIHFIDSLLLQPYIYSSSVNAHPLEIFLVILISGNVGGIIAMIFAIPSYTILRIIINELKVKELSE
ncbi:MAG: AI-2E family transporter [Flavobacteriales bacterium]